MHKVSAKSLKERLLEAEILNPNSDRWKKKKARITELSNTTQKLRTNVSRDIQSDDQRLALTALVVALMDRTAERIGNNDSADNGHFGVTGFKKEHVSIVGNKVHLEYVGKSGKEHEKSFSDERIAKALKKAIRNAPRKFIFETSDGFRIQSDKVNRYLEPFKICAKDIRGYNANRWIIEQLHKGKEASTPKERKKIFNKAVKETALRVGHGSGTLKKHYMIPELPTEYINHGRIIDIKTLGYYKDGSIITKPDSNTYTCFSDYIKQNNPALLERISTTDISADPKLEEELDSEYKMWYGGKIKK